MARSKNDMRSLVNETNRLFKDFGLKERIYYEDWMDKTPISLLNYRKQQINNYLDEYDERCKANKRR